MPSAKPSLSSRLSQFATHCRQKGARSSLKSVAAPSVARGILDAIREENADLVVLGLNKPDHGQVVIGAIPENVAETAPCDVVIYRAGVSSHNFERVVVPANGSNHARVASRVAIMLGESFPQAGGGHLCA